MIECDNCQAQSAVVKITMTDLQGVLLEAANLCRECMMTETIREVLYSGPLYTPTEGEAS